MGTFLLHRQNVLIFELHVAHFSFAYRVDIWAHVLLSVFQPPVKGARLQSSCPVSSSALERVPALPGNLTINPSLHIVFFIIWMAKLRRNSSCVSDGVLLPRALECTAFDSATEQMKVNCRVGHHLVFQT